MGFGNCAYELSPINKKLSGKNKDLVKISLG